jgi:hypothetical protein
MAPPTSDVRLRIIAENLARAALQEAKRDVQGLGTAAGSTGADFGKLVFANGNLIASTSNARRGVHLFENALRALSFQAAGIPGSVGKAAQGIGMLGIGSLWVTGAIAGLGGVALAIRALTSDAREAGKAADELAKSVGNLTVGDKLRAIQTNLGEAGQGVFAAQSRAQQGIASNPILEWIALIKQNALEDAGEKAVAAVLAVRDARERAHADLAISLEHEADLIGTTAEEAARLKAGWLGLTDAETANYVAAAKRLERRKEENRALEAQRDLLQQLADISADVSGFFAQPFQQDILAAIKVPTLPEILAQEGQRQAGLQVTEIQKQGEQFAFENFDQAFFNNVQAGVNEALATTPGFKNGGMVMAQAFASAVGQFARGGPAGIFGGAGDLLTGASQVKQFASASSFLGPAGFALSAVSSIISVFDGSAERRHKEVIRELKKISERPILEGRVLQPIYLNDRNRTGVYQAGRDQERDVVDRGLDRP